jgi:hypothetical protein
MRILIGGFWHQRTFFYAMVLCIKGSLNQQTSFSKKKNIWEFFLWNTGVGWKLSLSDHYEQEDR